MATELRSKEEQIVYQSSLKAAIEYLKLNNKTNVGVQELFNLTYIMSEYCLYNTKKDENFKILVTKIDEMLNDKKA